MWFNVFMFNIFTCFFTKVKKTCFYVFYLQINVFNIDGLSRVQEGDRKQIERQTSGR